MTDGYSDEEHYQLLISHPSFRYFIENCLRGEVELSRTALLTNDNLSEKETSAHRGFLRSLKSLLNKAYKSAGRTEGLPPKYEAFFK